MTGIFKAIEMNKKEQESKLNYLIRHMPYLKFVRIISNRMRILEEKGFHSIQNLYEND